MQFGIHLLGLGRRASVEDCISAAQAAEELGYHSVWINDHVVIPSHFTARYPYSADGRPSFTPDDTFYDPFVLLAAVAARTKTIKLGTGVIVIPHRPPILAAKAVATLDVISGGRFILGLGVGWFADELEVLGVSFRDRAKVSRSYLNTMKSLWAETRVHLASASGQSVEVGFAPKPLQQPHPPLWFGGESRPALKRVVEQGDGWFPWHLSPEGFAVKAGELKRLCAEHGRDFPSLTICVFSTNRAHYSVEAIRAYRQHGASIMLAPLGNPSLNEFIVQLKQFRDDVMAPTEKI
jgi:probable F420-dependent oxidoreductase